MGTLMLKLLSKEIFKSACLPLSQSWIDVVPWRQCLKSHSWSRGFQPGFPVKYVGAGRNHQRIERSSDRNPRQSKCLTYRILSVGIISFRLNRWNSHCSSNFLSTSFKLNRSNVQPDEYSFGNNNIMLDPIIWYPWEIFRLVDTIQVEFLGSPGRM